MKKLPSQWLPVPVSVGGLPALVIAAAVVATSALAAQGLAFERVFNADHEPAQLHFKADYVVSGQAHHVEVWRDGERRLRRRTDDAIETLVSQGDDAALEMQVYDLRRGLQTRISRDNLMRLGHGVDWFGLSHGLSQPPGDALVEPSGRPAEADPPIAACDWYAMDASRICWSASWRIPLLITDQAGHAQWQVRAADSSALDESVFVISAPGFVVNDANADIQGD